MKPLFCILFFTVFLHANQPASAAESKPDTAKGKSDLDRDCKCVEGSFWKFIWSKDEESPKSNTRTYTTPPPSPTVAEGLSRGTLRPFLELSSKLSNPGDEALRMQGFRLGLSEHHERVLALAYYKSSGETTLRPGVQYELQYGGIVFGGLPEVRSITETYVSLLLGTGQAKIQTPVETRNSRPLFVVEPELGLAVNLSSWLQLGAGVSYRYINGLAMMGVRSEDLRGWTANLHIRLHALGSGD